MTRALGVCNVTPGQLGVLGVVALVALVLKRHYADASPEALGWILAPTTYLVSVVTGTAFTAVPGEGYFSAERLFLIEKACAGVNFMIAALVMTSVMLCRRVRSVHEGALVLGLALVTSYVSAVFVNTLRIVIAMWLVDHPFTSFSLMSGDVHRLEGIVVYFGGLLLLYEIIQRIDRSGSVWRFALPLGCYYVVTLALPLARGAASANPAFVTHALTVLVLPPALVLFVFGIRQLAYSLNRTLHKVISSPPRIRGYRGSCRGS